MIEDIALESLEDLGRSTAADLFQFHNLTAFNYSNYAGPQNSTGDFSATNVQSFALPQGTPAFVPLSLGDTLYYGPAPTSKPTPEMDYTIEAPAETTWLLAYFYDYAGKSFAGVLRPLFALGYLKLDFAPGGTKMVVIRAVECALTFCVREVRTSAIGTQLSTEVLSTTYGTFEYLQNEPQTWPAMVNGTNLTMALGFLPQNLLNAVPALLGSMDGAWTAHCELDSEVFNISKCTGLPFLVKSREDLLVPSSGEMGAINKRGNFSQVMGDVE